MCGIAGIVDLKGGSILPQRMQLMNRAQYRRGPDSSGVWIEGPVGLGHCRLKILDLTETGSQPMISATGRFVITFNGEIYNFPELRTDLESVGVVFRGTSDTEVLLEAYAQWGPRAVQRLEGMFAFAIYDKVSEELFLARDRFGKKPLHYALLPNEFIFASEIKGLIAAGGISGEWDPCALSDYLSFGYVLTPRTIYRHIYRLPASCFAVLKAGRLSIESYWSLLSTFRPKVTVPEDHRIAEFLNRFDDAVKSRLVSDVPLGAFLSGGIDSSSVVASMSRNSTSVPRTFSMAFANSSYNESRWAAEVAEYTGAVHHNELVDPTDQDVFSCLAEVFDEPFADTSAIPMWHLARLTRKNVTVALSGDGADEMLAGYPTYRANQYFRIYQVVPQWARIRAAQLALRFPHFSSRKVGIEYKARQFFIGGTDGAWKAHCRWRELFSEEAKKRIMTPDLERQTRGYDPFEVFRKYFEEAAGLEFLDACLYVDAKTWLQDDILVKVDRTTMAHSLEARAPFLDSRLVDWTSRLPVEDKYSHRQGKAILKKAMRGRVPSSVIFRAKSGFNAPTQGLPLEIPRDNGLVSDAALGESRTEFQRYGLAVLGLHLAKL
ncbi:MAG: asparagine synthase (glutamine-hydrolyzing) [Thermodesulfobacteriota bacterium]